MHVCPSDIGKSVQCRFEGLHSQISRFKIDSSNTSHPRGALRHAEDSIAVGAVDKALASKPLERLPAAGQPRTAAHAQDLLASGGSGQRRHKGLAANTLRRVVATTRLKNLEVNYNRV